MKRLKPLPRSFYRDDVVDVARALVGCVLVHDTPQGRLAGRIVETEAYRGPQDLASHASRGRTRRTEAMFGPPGHAYMFLLYGMHWAFNVVTAEVGTPHAILVRALEPVSGLEEMSASRNVDVDDVRLTNGPGKLCQAMGLGGQHYGWDLCGGNLFVAPGVCGEVGRSARINVDYAGPWASRRWRFFEKGNRYVSVHPRD